MLDNIKSSLYYTTQSSINIRDFQFHLEYFNNAASINPSYFFKKNLEQYRCLYRNITKYSAHTDLSENSQVRENVISTPLVDSPQLMGTPHDANDRDAIQNQNENRLIPIN